VDTVSGGIGLFSGDNEEPRDIECKVWLDAIKGKSEVVVKPEQVFIVTKILDTVYKSAESGRQIIF
jgi:predicted dehydrogenase